VHNLHRAALLLLLLLLLLLERTKIAADDHGQLKI